MKDRSQIAEQYKWDLSKFCKNDEDFQSRFENLEKNVNVFAKYENKLADEELLFECLELEQKYIQEFSLVMLYCDLNLYTDLTDKKANEQNEKLSALATKFSVATTFIDVEICKFSINKLKNLIDNDKFKNYKRFFENIIKEKKHALSKKEEKILSSFGEVFGGFSSNYDKFADADLKFNDVLDSKGNKHELTHSSYLRLLESQDRTLRKNTSIEMFSTFGKYINFLSSNYASDVKTNCIFAELRKYPSALARALSHEEVEEKVYRLLIEKVRQNISLVDRYYALKKKYLNLDNLATYDLHAPLTKSNKKYTYQEGVEIIKKALTVLGKDYLKLLDRAVNERWIDVFPNKNKTSGAFSTGCYGATPVVLMNFEGNLWSVMTLAHELGHAMHTYFSNKTQPIQTADYKIFVAEVASTTNELLMLDYLIKNCKDKKEKLIYYNEFLSQMNSSMFRQTMFAEFEEKVHSSYEAGEPLTAEFLCKTYAELVKFYSGKNLTPLKESRFGWARIPHFYSSFYVYKYATSFICSCLVSQKLLTEKDFVNKYINFLSSGSSKDPVSLLKELDCDLTDAKTYEKAFDFCKHFLSEWEEL